MPEQFESFLGGLQEKHDAQDASTEASATAIHEKMEDTGHAKIIAKQLLEAMMREEYAVLDEMFASLQEQVGGLGVDMLNEKLAVVDAGIKDKEAGKYDTAMKALKEIKEML